MPTSVMLGASGAISGAMGFVLWRVMNKPKMRIQLFILMAVVQPIMAWAAGTSLGGEIAWVAHLAGFVAGVIMAIYWPKPAVNA
jgi:membrane associated rhomboid family serine protease